MRHRVLWRSGLRTAIFLLSVFGLLAQSDELARMSAQVKDLMAQGRFAEAVPLCRKLVVALPSNPGLRLNLAMALQMSGHPGEAIPEFETVLRSQPQSFPALISLGMSYLETGDPARAAAPLERAVAIDPNNVNARGMLAGALFGLGRVKESATHYRRLTELEPRDPKGWHGLGRAYEALSGMAFDELGRAGEGSPEWLSLVADTRLARRQYRSAFFFYQQALEKRPAFRPALAGMAAVYRASNHADWAAAQEKKVAALPPVDCAREKGACDFAAHRYLDAASSPSPYWRARAYDELARQAFARLGTLPESPELHGLLADVAANQRAWVEAAKQWRAAVALVPGEPRFEEQLMIALEQGSNYREALPIAERLLARNPRSAELNFFAGEARLRLEQPEQAVPLLEGALRLNPQLTPAHASLGLAYMRTGRPADAIPHLEAALETDDDGSLHFQLARAYQSSGDAEKARAAMAKYQELRKQNEAEKREVEEKAQITAPR